MMGPDEGSPNALTCSLNAPRRLKLLNYAECGYEGSSGSSIPPPRTAIGHCKTTVRAVRVRCGGCWRGGRSTSTLTGRCSLPVMACQWHDDQAPNCHHGA